MEAIATFSVQKAIAPVFFCQTPLEMSIITSRIQFRDQIGPTSTNFAPKTTIPFETYEGNPFQHPHGHDLYDISAASKFESLATNGYRYLKISKDQNPQMATHIYIFKIQIAGK